MLVRLVLPVQVLTLIILALLCLAARSDVGGGLNAYVVVLQGENRQFPGPQATVGLCAEGGLGRSTFNTVGYLRAFEDLGLMRSIDAISAVSAGCLASALYMFSNRSLDALLGTPMEPTSLTLTQLDKKPPQMVDMFEGDWMRRITLQALKWEIGLSRFHKEKRVWQYLVNHYLLEAHERLNARMAASSPAVDDIKARNPVLRNAKFVTPSPGRPSVFVMNTIMRGLHAGVEDAVPLQISPDFTGSPFLVNGNGTVSDGLGSRVRVGGGLVESFAFGGPAPEASSSNLSAASSFAVKMGTPRRPFTLLDAVSSCIGVARIGIETDNIPDAVRKILPKNLIKELNSNLRYSYWPVIQGVRQSSYTLEDGGILENTGLLALLQRGVKKIILPVHPEWPLRPADEFDYCARNLQLRPEGADVHTARIHQALFDKFGYKYVVKSFYYVHNQVFAKADLWKLMCALHRKRERKEPLVVWKTLQVLPNEWWGIRGGFNVDLLVIYNQKHHVFEEMLPSETQVALKQGRLGSSTPTHFDEQHNLLAQLRGRKSCVLFAPESYTSLYPFPTTHPADRVSMVDVERPQQEQFPRSQNLSGLTAVLNAGDALFIPYGWWHQCRNLEHLTASVTFWAPAAAAHVQPSGIDKNKWPLLRRNLEKLVAEAVGAVSLGTSVRQVLDALRIAQGEKHPLAKQLIRLAGLVGVPMEHREQFVRDTFEGRFELGMDYQHFL